MRAMCGMCSGMMKGPRAGLAAIAFAVLLVAVGVLIFVEPRIVVWLAGAGAILIGVMVLVMARFARRACGRE